MNVTEIIILSIFAYIILGFYSARRLMYMSSPAYNVMPKEEYYRTVFHEEVTWGHSGKAFYTGLLLWPVVAVWATWVGIQAFLGKE